MEKNENKSDKRNEIIRAFRKYARLGLLDSGLNPIQIYKKIEMLCVSRRSRLDMFAVFDTLRLLELDDDDDTIDAIYAVYFEGKAYRLTKRESGRRVLDIAHEQYCDSRTIYRRLEKARALYEKVREKEGLILDGKCSEF